MPASKSCGPRTISASKRRRRPTSPPTSLRPAATRRSRPTFAASGGWMPVVRLHSSVNSEPEAAAGEGVEGTPRVVTAANGVKFLAWDFNDIDVSGANDPLNRLDFWLDRRRGPSPTATSGPTPQTCGRWRFPSRTRRIRAGDLCPRPSSLSRCAGRIKGGVGQREGQRRRGGQGERSNSNRRISKQD